jgi:serine/threonine protein kinase
MSLSSGTRLGPYEILSLLGAGGMGEVYRGRDPRLGRDIAIKVLPAAFTTDPDRLRRFEQEARAVGVLNHPNILAVHDIGTTAESAPYIVSELLEGETLRQRLASGALPVRKTIDCGLQIARGLAAAHAKGIVHRDLKPENLFLTRDGRVKILDFGLAKLTELDVAAYDRTSVPTIRVATDPGLVMGTVAYMSPEQVRALLTDHRSDLFSFGAILYEMLSGRRAFQRETAPETMTAILRDDLPELAATTPNISPGLEQIVRHCLEKNPEERFQSARDVAFAFEAISGPSTSSGGAVPLDVRLLGRVKPQAMWATVGLVIGLLIGVTPEIVMWQQRPPAATPVHLSALLPGSDILAIGGSEASIAISPDGQTLVYRVGPPGPFSRLDRRSLTDGLVTPMSGTEGASDPFFSPDGQWIGFAKS